MCETLQHPELSNIDTTLTLNLLPGSVPIILPSPGVLRLLRDDLLHRS